MPNWSLLLPAVLVVACSYEGQGNKSLPVAGAGQVEQVDQVIQSEQNAENVDHSQDVAHVQRSQTFHPISGLSMLHLLQVFVNQT